MHVISPEDSIVWPKMMKTYRSHSLGEWRYLVSYQEISFSPGLKLSLVIRSHSLGEWRHLVSYQEIDLVWD